MNEQIIWVEVPQEEIWLRYIKWLSEDIREKTEEIRKEMEK